MKTDMIIGIVFLVILAVLMAYFFKKSLDYARQHKDENLKNMYK